MKMDLVLRVIGYGLSHIDHRLLNIKHWQFGETVWRLVIANWLFAAGAAPDAVNF